MGTGLIERAEELSTLTRFLDDLPKGPAALLLEGEAGIGKTALWIEGLQASRARLHTVLSCRPIESETQLPFASLGDALEGLPDSAFSDLPTPQRRALDAALLRAEPATGSTEQRAIGLAVLSVLRTLASSSVVVVAVDDVQWVDSPTARVFEFAIRRLRTEPVGVLVARRGGGQDKLPLMLATFPAERMSRVKLGPLSAGALNRLIVTRLGLQFSRSTLVRLYVATGGNPFFALELARALARQGAEPAPGEPLPIPDSLGAVVGHRLAELSPLAREAAVIVAALSQPSAQIIKLALGDSDTLGTHAALKETIETGVLESEGDRIRFSHPLLASILYQGLLPEQRRELHRRLSALVPDLEERARHLALSAEGADEQIAAVLEQSAHRTRARGAPDSAAELAERARRLTPPGLIDNWRRRGIEAADYHFAAGNTGRAAEILEEIVTSTAAGPARAHVLRRLAVVRYHNGKRQVMADLFERALSEAGDDLRTKATVVRDQAWLSHMHGQVVLGRSLLEPAVELAGRLEDTDLLAEMLPILVFSQSANGIRDEATVERMLALESRTGQIAIIHRPAFVLAVQAKWMFHLSAAREQMETQYRLALEVGDFGSLPFLLYHLSELESWAGRYETALQHAEEGHEAAVQTGQETSRTLLLYCQALAEAHLGRVHDARVHAEEGLILADRIDIPLRAVQNLTALGFVALSTQKFDRAREYHDALLARQVARMGPSPHFFHNVIETLVALGELEQAAALLVEFEEGQQDKLWGGWVQAIARRCRALLASSQGKMDVAIADAEDSVKRLEQTEVPFDLARSLLVLGTVHRRSKHKRQARETLERAAQLFDDLKAVLWAQRARAELGRIGGRAATRRSLTETERRVAQLVASGHTNREVADTLFLAVKTVEWNLSRIYQKLGVRSRSELAAMLATASIAPTNTLPDRPAT